MYCNSTPEDRIYEKIEEINNNPITLMCMQDSKEWLEFVLMKTVNTFNIQFNLFLFYF